MKRYCSIFGLLCSVVLLYMGYNAKLNAANESVQLIVRGDDFGMTHAANMAIAKGFEQGILTCSSILTIAPWFEEAARITRENPGWCIGVHLALNGEWRDYRWKPVLPVTEVPSLVDEDGYFYQTEEAFLAANPSLEEVEKELRAQVELALRRKIDIQYVDTHMGTARATPELHDIVKRISQDYGVPISQGYEGDRVSIYEVPYKRKEKALAEELKKLGPGLWLLVVHPGLDTPEARALVDANPEGLKDVALHRAAVTKALTSKKIKRIVEKRNIQLTDYRKLQAQK
ncbi:MAG: polysaccharide deacetylase family protein [Candidatus Aminicenantes bacterium]|nr:MAG: polysaccharide deacetylase family protein [Candidatus Aminicenantes bacterium]